MTGAHITAHQFCTAHREQLKKDSICGCFNCLTIFSPTHIEKWVNDRKGESAVCPYCGIDSIIGESSGYPITKEFLQKMNMHWF